MQTIRMHLKFLKYYQIFVDISSRLYVKIDNLLKFLTIFFITLQVQQLFPSQLQLRTKNHLGY
jgi:hypothetical protein